MNRSEKGPVVLCILDGWGKRAETDANAIAQAQTPTWDRMCATYPTGEMVCHGEDVGLPEDQMGNSEVGHLNLGAGRIVWQDLPRINTAIADGSLAQNTNLRTFIEKLRTSGGACHLVGLMSPGGVHAHQAHAFALAKIVSRAGVPVRIHAFTDGRDTAPASAADDMTRLDANIADLPDTRIASVCGRYFAMDRDNRWDRVIKAYDLICDAIGVEAVDARDAVEASYAAGITDEFIEPVVITPKAPIEDRDGLLFINFRADRARQLLDAFLRPDFEGFPRRRRVKLTAALGMVSYSTTLDAQLPAIFPPDHLSATLGETISAAGRSQLRLAETEKYPHVTFFFNGGRETPFPQEDRILAPSPQVATYDLAPEMSAKDITRHLVESLRLRRHDAIIVNFANGDMVGHTGKLDAAITACATVDQCLTEIEHAVLEANGAMLVTADHGNCEMMIDPKTGEPHTAHTLNPVSTVLVSTNTPGVSLRNGRLADVAPTILDLLGIPQPPEMTGETLCVRRQASLA
ncbi:MAG: 2,3-bisphosphoglycerate-independent phosphoglycerate mutase [Pseudomonadota bacterium]